MKPEYEQYRGDRRTPKEIAAVRLPAELKAEAELIASAEDDTLSGLLVEGIARVIEDRRSDPAYAANIQQTVQAQVQSLESQLAAARSLLGGMNSTDLEQH